MGTWGLLIQEWQIQQAQKCLGSQLPFPTNRSCPPVGSTSTTWGLSISSRLPVRCGPRYLKVSPHIHMCDRLRQAGVPAVPNSAFNIHPLCSLYIPQRLTYMCQALPVTNTCNTKSVWIQALPLGICHLTKEMARIL